MILGKACSPKPWRPTDPEDLSHGLLNPAVIWVSFAPVKLTLRLTWLAANTVIRESGALKGD